MYVDTKMQRNGSHSEGDARDCLSSARVESDGIVSDFVNCAQAVPDAGAPLTTTAHPLVEEARDAAGRVMVGNRLAVTHALSAVDLPPGLQHLRDEIAEYEAACLIDEGSPDDVPARRRSLLQSRARVERRIRQLDDALELRGLTDKNDRLRVSWLQQLATLIGTAIRLDSLLGLERRAKRVPSVDDYLNGQAHR